MTGVTMEEGINKIESRKRMSDKYMYSNKTSKVKNKIAVRFSHTPIPMQPLYGLRNY